MIEAEKATYTVERMCDLLEVSRWGYCKWRKSRDSGPTPAQQRRAELDAKVAKFHAASDGVYGAPRILAGLRDDGEQVSRKTVAASLRRQGLAGVCPRRFTPATTVVDLAAAVPNDLVKRRFGTGLLDRVWTSDITYLGIGEGWLELAEQVVMHADRGCQYTLAQLGRFAREHNLARSVGRTGVCLDNGP